jgi:hypothetical protein
MSEQPMNSPAFRIGDVVTYETLDEEYYSRGYGIHMETKASTIISICYKLANGDVIEEKKLLLVKPPEQKIPTKQ